MRKLRACQFLFKIAVCFASVGFFVGCNDETSDPVYSQYQLPDGITLNIDQEVAVVINDEASFEQLFSNYPDAKRVDFRKNTLLLVRGVSTHGIAEIKKSVSRTNDSNYIFAIAVVRNVSAVVESWDMAFVLPKTSPERITCSVEYK